MAERRNRAFAHRTSGAALALFLPLACSVAFAQELPAGTTLDPQAALVRSQAAVGKQLGDYTLIDSDGQPLRLANLRGKPLVVSFIYTGCFQVCPTTTRFLDRAVREAQRALGPGTFNVATVGFNLPFDTPTAMQDFRRRNGLETPGWHFLSGDAATIHAMARDLGFAWVSTAAGFDHLTQATIVDGDGRVVQQVYGDAFELPMFVAPLKALAAGETAPAPDLASILERVRILCTVYDPRSGRYRLNYGLFIEIFVGLSILGATGWYLAAEWRRNRSTRLS